MTNPLQEPQHDSPDQLKQAVRSGTRKVAAIQVVSQIVSLASLAILFRTISDNPPHEYGLLAMVVPVVMFLRIFTLFGLDISIVQHPGLDTRQLSSVFWLNLLLGTATAGVTALLAPSVARFYGESELYPLTLALAATAIVAALGAPHQALLQRRLRLGRLALVRLAAQTLGATAAVFAALAGWGVWALIVQQYLELVLLAILAWVAAPWRPNRPSLRPTKLLEDLRSHLRFGGYHTASSVLFYLADNLDKVLVGRLVGPAALGLYSQAFNLAFKPVALLCTPLTGIMLASLSRSNDHRAQQDSSNLRREMLVAFYRVAAIVLLPIAIGLAVVGGDAIRLLGGESWTASGPILQVLALAIFGRALIHLAGPVFSAAGKTDRLFFGSIAVLLLLVQGYIAGWWFGAWQGNATLGVACGYTFITTIVLAIPFTLYCLASAEGEAPGAQTSLREVTLPILRALGRPLFAALLMGMVVLALKAVLDRYPMTPLFAKLLVEVAAGVAVYCLLAKSQIRWVYAQLTTTRPNQTAVTQS